MCALGRAATPMAPSRLLGYLSLSPFGPGERPDARGVDLIQLADRRADRGRVRGRTVGHRIPYPGAHREMGRPAPGGSPRAPHRPGPLPPNHRLAGRVLRRLSPALPLPRAPAAMVRPVAGSSHGFQDT